MYGPSHYIFSLNLQFHSLSSNLQKLLKDIPQNSHR